MLLPLLMGGGEGRKINQAVKLLSYLLLGQGFDREITTDSWYFRSGRELIYFISIPINLVTAWFNHGLFFFLFSAVHDLRLLLCGHLTGVLGQWHLQDCESLHKTRAGAKQISWKAVVHQVKTLGDYKWRYRSVFNLCLFFPRQSP